MKLNKLFLIAALILSATQMISAMTIRGVVKDQETREPLLGAAVMIVGTTNGTSTGFDGDFELKVEPGQQIMVAYISYLSTEFTAEKGQKEVEITLAPDTQMLESVEIVTKANLETEANLQNERMASHVAIENLGVREMSLKGLSNVEDGVKKMTGISVADAGQIIVRGLGDRYSSTTLNGLPIASPNPDKKLIPLDIFPSSAVKNITVSKVYDAKVYADYSGAHIDIASKDLTGDNFFSVGFGLGADFSAIGKDFYAMDNVSLFTKSSFDPSLSSMTSAEYKNAISTRDVFDTTFDVNKSTGLPSFSGNLGFGRNFDIGNQKLGILLTGSISNDHESTLGAYYSTLTSTGTIKKSNSADEYSSSLDIASLASVGLSMRKRDHIGYTLFYARNASTEYSYNYDGINDDKNINYVSSNNVNHIYTLMTNQLNGEHHFGNQFKMNWSGAYTTTKSDEPDNRQTLFSVDSKYGTRFYTDTGDETNRYFSVLDESEYSADIDFEYTFMDNQKLSFGAAYKSKNRDFGVTKFYYNTSGLGGVEMDNIYDLDNYLSYENIAAGNLSLSMSTDPVNSYTAGTDIFAAYLTTTLNFGEKVMLDFGLRMENSYQYVDYMDKNGVLEGIQTSDIDKLDLFPSFNLRYSFAEKKQARLAISKTITRPSFLEMSPYEYRESYGAPIIMGSCDIDNGYNYNVDLRYESFFDGGDMFSVTGYYKYLETPIERITEYRAGSTVYTFDNVDEGLAAGVELEVRKRLVGDLKLGFNASYIYTKVNLPSNGNYTNSERDLQGASPYLVNVDLTYTPIINDKQLSLALLYNLQGPRIHAVGISGAGDVVQRDVHMLNFTAGYDVSSLVRIGAKFSNLLALPYVFEQYMPLVDKTFVVEEYNPGIQGEITVSLKF